MRLYSALSFVAVSLMLVGAADARRYYYNPSHPNQPGSYNHHVRSNYRTALHSVAVTSVRDPGGNTWSGSPSASRSRNVTRPRSANAASKKVSTTIFAPHQYVRKTGMVRTANGTYFTTYSDGRVGIPGRGGAGGGSGPIYSGLPGSSGQRSVTRPKSANAGSKKVSMGSGMALAAAVARGVQYRRVEYPGGGYRLEDARKPLPRSNNPSWEHRAGSSGSGGFNTKGHVVATGN
jgi:hypothetical protein